MNRVLAVSISLGVIAALFAGIALLRKRFPIVRALSFVLFVAAVAVGLAIYKATGVTLLPDFEALFIWLITTLAAITVLRLVGIYVFDVYLRLHRKVHVAPLVPSLALGLAYLLASLLVLRAVYPGLNLGPLLATSAVTSLVLGLALQPILGNFFAGVAISFEQPYRIDDWIKVHDTEGRVVDITWRTTHVRTRDNDDLVIPNLKAADEYILNYHYPNRLHLARIYVSAAYSAAPYRVRQALLACAPLVAGVLEKPEPDVYVRDFAASTIDYELRVWIEDMAAIDRIKSDLRQRIWESFQRHGLSFPFPTRTLEFAPAARPPAPPGSPRIGVVYVAEGAAAGTSIRLSGQSVRIGRGADNDLVLPDAQISKDHARIDCEADGFVIEDLGSSGGTLVNGATVTRQRLEPYDRIKLGSTVLSVEYDAH